MNDVNTCSKLLKLSLALNPRLELHAIYPAPEIFKHTVKHNELHNLDLSRGRRPPLKELEALTYVYLQLELLLGGEFMARNNKSGNLDGMPEMVSSKLTDEELLAFDQWLPKNEKNIWRTLTEILLDDIKLGVSWDAYNDCFVSSFTGKGDRQTNTGRCLMSRSSDWQEAIAINIFKHLEIYKRGKWENRNADKQRG